MPSGLFRCQKTHSDRSIYGNYAHETFRSQLKGPFSTTNAKASNHLIKDHMYKNDFFFFRCLDFPAFGQQTDLNFF